MSHGDGTGAPTDRKIASPYGALLPVVELREAVLSCEEDDCWDHCARTLAAVLPEEATWSVRYSPRGPRGFSVATCGAGHHEPAVTIRVNSGPSWAQLGADDEIESPPLVEMLLAIALSAYETKRLTRLRGDANKLKREVQSRFVHATRNHVSSLANLSELALRPEFRMLGDPADYRDAIEHTTAEAQALLRGASLVARAAPGPRPRCTAKLPQAVRQLAPRACIELPEGQDVRLPLDDEVLVELLSTIADALDQEPRRFKAFEHVDGWAMEFAGAEVPDFESYGWADLRHQLPLGLAAIACNDLGGRTWAKVPAGGMCPVLLGWTLPEV